MMSIRRAKKNDLLEIVDLEKAAFGDDGYNKLMIRQLYDLFPSLIFVFEENNKIVAYVIGGIQEDRNIIWMLALGTSEYFRSKGIGTMLSKRLIQEMEALNIKEMLLTVSPNNEIAKSLYLGIGFTKIGENESYFGTGQSRDIFSYKLK